MEQQEITIGQVTYELRRVFRGGRPLSELLTEQLARYSSAGGAEACSPGLKRPQNIPAARSVDEGSGYEV